MIAGEQCLETPAGANRAGAGQTMTVPPNVPMELNVTGKTLRRAFALVIHDSTQAEGYSIRLEAIRKMWPAAWLISGCALLCDAKRCAVRCAVRGADSSL